MGNVIVTTCCICNNPTIYNFIEAIIHKVPLCNKCKTNNNLYTKNKINFLQKIPEKG